MNLQIEDLIHNINELTMAEQAECYEKAYASLDEQTKKTVNSLLSILEENTRNMGRKSSLELLAKIGIQYCHSDKKDYSI